MNKVQYIFLVNDIAFDEDCRPNFVEPNSWLEPSHA